MSELLYEASGDPVRNDGRGIDAGIGSLTGEGSSQVPGFDNSQSHLPTLARNQGYYGRPMLKEPVWKWVIPMYYYIGGAAGASLALGASAQMDRSGKLDNLVRHCRNFGAAGTVLSAGLLIFDLGRPSRFINMLRVFRPTSPMNMGTWILGATSSSAIAASLLAGRSKLWSRLGDGCGIVSGVSGLALATYTGVLVGNSAIPLWSASRRFLPVLFGASAISSASSFFDLFVDDRQARRITYTFGTIGRVAELAATVALETHLSGSPRIASPLKNGATGILWKAAAALTAGSLVASLLPNSSRKKRVVAGALGTLGSLALRYAIHHAGVRSSRDSSDSTA